MRVLERLKIFNVMARPKQAIREVIIQVIGVGIFPKRGWRTMSRR
jgi:hypothetical protein